MGLAQHVATQKAMDDIFLRRTLLRNGHCTDEANDALTEDEWRMKIAGILESDQQFRDAMVAVGETALAAIESEDRKH